MTSSNNFKNFSSSSGIVWGRMKEDNNNINNLSNFPIANPHPKGRKLIDDFDKINNKNLQNEVNVINNNPINNNNISSNYNISNNNFSFLTPNNKPKKETEKESEKKIELIKDKKLIINDRNNANHNIFFTDYGLGYKCNCQKTQCNKYYCQCFREGRYCFNCNCIDCNNQKPEFFTTNKHLNEEENKDKKSISVSCTCTKSGCNKNYCECFKSKVKCNNLCRCRNCENCEDGKEEKNIGLQNYECCPANSIFIIKNKIILEDVNKNKNNKKTEIIKRQIKITISENLLSSCSSEEKENLGHKRKRNNDSNIEIEKSASNKNSKYSDENTNETTKNKKKKYIEGDLFDKDGKLILTNFKL